MSRRDGADNEDESPAKLAYRRPRPPADPAPVRRGLEQSKLMHELLAEHGISIEPELSKPPAIAPAEATRDVGESFDQVIAGVGAFLGQKADAPRTPAPIAPTAPTPNTSRGAIRRALAAAGFTDPALRWMTISAPDLETVLRYYPPAQAPAPQASRPEAGETPDRGLDP